MKSKCFFFIILACKFTAANLIWSSIESPLMKWRTDKKISSFDFYVLASSWQPEFCREEGMHEHKELPGCQHPQMYWKDHFTVHGLWPELQHGPHPGSCSNEKFDRKIIDQIGMANFTKYWPNAKFTENSTKYTEFWRHEWSKHGTCSGLDQAQYFEQAMQMLQSLEDSEKYLATGGSIPKSAIQKAYGGKKMVALKCNGGTRLSQTFTCWTKQASQNRHKQIPCASHILSEDNCYNSTLYISKFSNLT